MGAVMYSMTASLDGYTADEAGNFDFTAPDEEVHAVVNDLERPIGTYLLGRRMYETMRYWETAPGGPDQHEVPDQLPVERDFTAIWQAADKTAALPHGIRLALELLDEHRFSNGTVFLRYRLAA